MRVLVVEDQGVAAAMATTELTSALHCEVSTTTDPLDAIDVLTADKYDVVVVDMLYLSRSHEFEARRRQGLARLTDQRLHLSGLAVLHAVGKRGLDTRPLLWTSGEPNRRLHILFAYEQLGCRVLCSKTAIAQLAPAVQAAATGSEYVDPVLRMYFPPRFSTSLHETFLSSSTKLAVWRAMALGQLQHKTIARTAGVQPSTVKKGMDDMRARLLGFDPGYPADGSPSAELIRYASQNWEFFLDDTVREMFP